MYDDTSFHLREKRDVNNSNLTEEVSQANETSNETGDLDKSGMHKIFSYTFSD